MPEQLKYGKALKEWKAKQAAASTPAEKKENDGFKELSNEELGRLSMPEKLKYSKAFKEWKAK